MQCPECHTENPAINKFCRECGARLSLSCPQCGAVNTPSDRFCGDCGMPLDIPRDGTRREPKADSLRKHATVLFADISGYSSLAERLQPHEVKDIMIHLYEMIAQVVGQYEGLIESYVGDAVLALFGVPKAHEDDPIRAIRAAREIHQLLAAMSHNILVRLGHPLSVHIGINTGLIIIGETHGDKGTQCVAGDTINVAARLCDLAKPGETLVGQNTYKQAEGFFTFEHWHPVKVKGKAESVEVYRVLAPKDVPSKTHRLSGRRAELIGRRSEMSQLSWAVERLQDGKGSIFAICGDAGTGKSRLLEDFKSSLDLAMLQWREGHAYPYSQNIPYYPLIDLLNRALDIEESDPLPVIWEKAEAGIKELVGEKEDIITSLGNLLSLSYPEVKEASPEEWQSRLYKAIQAIFLSLVQRSPTIICLEDLHWADPSSLELLRFMLSEWRYPALFLLAYRPPLDLFATSQLITMGKVYQEIRLQELSASETQEMVSSLLKTRSVPVELQRFVQEKVGGNPFYVEEVINSFIESENLIIDHGAWHVARPIDRIGMPATVQGILAARFDRLDNATRLILQEASVIGRTFFYGILNSITSLASPVDPYLQKLEKLDLIRARSLYPDLEYSFKHALIQEVAYNGLLKKQRQDIHERVGLAMEQFFGDRGSDFCETLAFHFKQGRSVHKAIHYLVESGEKSLKRFALEESHQYYQEAYDLWQGITDRDDTGNKGLVDLLIAWAPVFYFRLDFKGLTDLFHTHKGLVEALEDQERRGIFYAWLGTAWFCRENMQESYRYAQEALRLGEERQNYRIIGLACMCLTWTCAELKLVDQAIVFGQRAQEVFRLHEVEPMVFFQSLGGMGLVYLFQGESQKNFAIGKTLLEYGRSQSNLLSTMVGYLCLAYGHYARGDFPAAIESGKRAREILPDKLFSAWPKIFLSMCFMQTGQFREAEELFQAILASKQEVGFDYVMTTSQTLLGAVLVARGRVAQGLAIIEEGRRAFIDNQRGLSQYMIEFTLGQTYFQMAQPSRPIALRQVIKNLGFIVKNYFSVRSKAETYLTNTIKMGQEIGARGIIQGQAYLSLGLLYKSRQQPGPARECISQALGIFTQCQAEKFMALAREALGAV